GITGLLIAQGLKKADIPCVVFGKEPPEGRPRDWSVSLHWSYSMLTELLTDDLLELFKSTQVDPSYHTSENDVLPVWNAETGEPMFAYRISRTKLRRLCLAGIDIHYCKRLSELSMSEGGEEVTAKFEDGTKCAGSAVVGSDGAKSVVRTFLVGEEQSVVQPIPFEAYMTNARYSVEDAKILPITRPYIPADSGGTLSSYQYPAQDVRDPEDPTTWEFMIMFSRPVKQGAPSTPDVDHLTEAKQLAAQCSDPFRTAWTNLPKRKTIWYTPLSYWEPIPWDNRGGRVTLGGDAAHAMTFHRGQGLNHAINDAWCYVTRFKEYVKGRKSLAEAMNEYDHELREWGREEVRASLQNTQMLHSWEECHNSPLFTRGLAKKQE
ncbi:FAD/NAD(P)-binding domain-containing protein, partial [Heliocybe sulcata]